MLGNFALWLPPNQTVIGSEIYEGKDALVHQARAIKTVNDRIRTGNDVTSEGLIGAVLGFTYHAVRLGDISTSIFF
jgi:hypothetical protein